jgi:hypothetical protein
MMITRKAYSYCRRPLVVVLCIGVALLASGCMWGMVKDANTGAPIGGATVTYTDSTGATASTTTDGSGQYSFEQAGRPAPGPVNLRVEASGYNPLTQQVQYADGSPPLWGVQSLIPASEPEPDRYHNASWGFSIEFPYDWMVIEGEEQADGTAVMGMAPPDDANDEYPEYCFVMAVALEPGMTLDTFFQLMLASMEEDPSGVQQLETGDANVNGQDAKWLLVAITESGTSVNSLIYLLAAHQRGYMIMCVSEAAQFPSHRSELEGIAQSFRIE